MRIFNRTGRNFFLLYCCLNGENPPSEAMGYSCSCHSPETQWYVMAKIRKWCFGNHYCCKD